MLQPLNKLADEDAQVFDIGQAIEFAVMGLPESSPKIGMDNTLTSQMVNLPMQIFTLALENLLENAIKATSEEAQPKVSIVISENDSELCVSCSDNGGGIPEDNLEQIFLPFFTTRSPGEGMGLGLSLSQNLIQLAGGDIRVSSKEFEGSTFTIHFPKDVIQHG
jgi:C4-dicarboxylate-specific signal transduction histidine kinase